jgi:hypothetical protein
MKLSVSCFGKKNVEDVVELEFRSFSMMETMFSVHPFPAFTRDGRRGSLSQTETFVESSILSAIVSCTSSKDFKDDDLRIREEEPTSFRIEMAETTTSHS